jgi:hypothetical protein
MEKVYFRRCWLIGSSKQQEVFHRTSCPHTLANLLILTNDRRGKIKIIQRIWNYWTTCDFRHRNLTFNFNIIFTWLFYYTFPPAALSRSVHKLRHLHLCNLQIPVEYYNVKTQIIVMIQQMVIKLVNLPQNRIRFWSEYHEFCRTLWKIAPNLVHGRRMANHPHKLGTSCRPFCMEQTKKPTLTE